MPFDNSITGNFTVYLRTDCFSIMFVVIFEVSLASEQKQA